MRYKVISYFSPEYKDHAQKLKESCSRWSLDAEVIPVKKFKSWKRGVMAKPRFILDALETYSANYGGILWLDADAYVVRPVPFQELEGADVAATKFRWSEGHKLEVLTGTLFFAITQKVKLFCEAWVLETSKREYSDTPEQDALAALLPAWSSTINFKELSIEWTYIDDDKLKELYPKAIPMIKHSQASRKIRREEFIRGQGTA